MKGSIKKVGWAVAMILFCGGVSHAAVANKSGGKGYEPGELIVKFRKGGEGRRDELHRRHGSRKMKEYPSYTMERVKVRSGSTVEEAVREFESDPDVEYAEPNYLVEALVVPTDPSYPQLWGMNKINAPAAWDMTTGSSEVVVAVIDSGIDVNHSDLKANLWVNPLELNGTPGVDDDNNGIADDIYGYNAITGTGDLTDDVGHGTHVAGTIGAAGNNGVGVAGVNWNVRIMACKFIGPTGGTSADAIACLHYVEQMKRRGVNIVATSNSWGGGAYSRALRDAIAAQQDILFIVAAGNDGTNSDVIPTYPASYDLPNVVSVAASTSADSLAVFSQYGRHTVHVAAPGSAIYSTSPGNSYATHSGTSMATPHVSGLAALIKAAKPAADWRAIKNLLLTGGNPLPALTGKTVTGRQIDAYGSLTCLDSRVLSALEVPSSATPGTPVTMSALSINCDAPLGPVTVTLANGVLYELKDDGIAPDVVAGDGIFTGSVTPTSSRETFYFSSPAGSEQVATPAPTAAPIF
jgi:subtilisin family serine protease